MPLCVPLTWPGGLFPPWFVHAKPLVTVTSAVWLPRPVSCPEQLSWLLVLVVHDAFERLTLSSMMSAAATVTKAARAHVRITVMMVVLRFTAPYLLLFSTGNLSAP